MEEGRIIHEKNHYNINHSDHCVGSHVHADYAYDRTSKINAKAEQDKNFFKCKEVISVKNNGRFQESSMEKQQQESRYCI